MYHSRRSFLVDSTFIFISLIFFQTITSTTINMLQIFSQQGRNMKIYCDCHRHYAAPYSILPVVHSFQTVASCFSSNLVQRKKRIISNQQFLFSKHNNSRMRILKMLSPKIDNPFRKQIGTPAFRSLRWSSLGTTMNENDKDQYTTNRRTNHQFRLYSSTTSSFQSNTTKNDNNNTSLETKETTTRITTTTNNNNTNSNSNIDNDIIIHDESMDNDSNRCIPPKDNMLPNEMEDTFFAQHKTFDTLGLRSTLLRQRIHDILQFHCPTSVQAATFQAIANTTQDVTVGAETGSGRFYIYMPLSLPIKA